MEKQYYLYDENFMYLSTNFYIEKPTNGVEFYPTIDTDFAKIDLENNVWIDVRL